MGFKHTRRDLGTDMHYDQVIIEGLPVHAKVGAYAEEQLCPQLLLIDLKIVIDFSKVFVSDALEDTVDYDFLSQHVRQFCQSSGFALIETLAGAIISEIFSLMNVTQVGVKIRKPGALSSGALASVCCERTREIIHASCTK